MFKKTDKSKQEITTLLGHDTQITGDVEFSGGLHVDGRIVGNILAAPNAEKGALLSVSEDGIIEGSVHAPDVVLNGTVKGDVTATNRVQLGATARVVGNVVYHLIEMAIGAEVNGKLVHREPGRPEPVPATETREKGAKGAGDSPFPSKVTGT